MPGMGRRKTIHKDIPPRMVARVMARGRRLYYYNAADGRRIPLGDDINLARMKWAEIEAGQAAGIHTFKAIAERYRAEVLPGKSKKTAHDQGLQIDRLIKVFGKVTLDEIRPRTVREYLDRRTAKIEANREIALLSHLWNTAREWGYTDLQNPCAGIRKNREKPRGIYVSDDDFGAVLGQADAPLQDAMRLAYHTGQRLADVLKMTIADIRDGAVWITQNKTGKKIAIAIEGDLATTIKIARERPRKATSIYLVQTDAGRPLTYTMLRKRFDKARELAGVNFQFRDIRPKSATDSESLSDAQALLGHESSATTRRHYRHIERAKPVHKTKNKPVK